MAHCHVDTLITGVHHFDSILFCIWHPAMASTSSPSELQETAEPSVAIESESSLVADLEDTVTEW